MMMPSYGLIIGPIRSLAYDTCEYRWWILRGRVPLTILPPFLHTYTHILFDQVYQDTLIEYSLTLIEQSFTDKSEL